MGIQWMMCWWVQVHCDLKLTRIWLSFIIINILRKAGASSAVWNSIQTPPFPIAQCWLTFESLFKDEFIL
jgi:hypothetical protein